MRRVFFLSIFFLLCNVSFSQELVQNEIDEFKGHTVKRTSWEVLSRTMKSKFQSFYRISNINGNYYLDIKLMIGMAEVFSIDEDEELLFKMEDDEIITLKNLRYEITCIGCGARGYAGSEGMGIQVSYPIPNKDLSSLRNKDAVRVRIYTTDGFVEEDLNPKNWSEFQKALSLVKD